MPVRLLISTSSFGSVDREPLERLEKADVRLRLNPHGRTLRPEEAIDLLSGMDAVIAGTERLDEAAFAAAPELRLIARCGAGLDNVDLEAARARGIEVTNTPEAHVDAVAELALAGILDGLRSLRRADADLRQGQWRKPMGRMLRGSGVGIVGFGRVGRRLAELLRPFEVDLVAHDIAPDEAAAHRLGVRYETLDTLLRTSDVITLHVPQHHGESFLLGAPELASMKPTAVLVNTARGGLVDEAALLEALTGGRLAAAYLDVFEREPYEGPLVDLPNVLLTPHLGSYATEARLQMELESVRHVLRFFGLEKPS